MRSAAVLMLAMVVVLALLSRSGRDMRSAEDQPQTSPPAQVEPKPKAPSITDDYEEAMKEAERKVILVFGAEWCPHCVLLKDHLGNMNLDGYLICVVDVDDHKELKRKYKARSLPTSVMLDAGKEVSRKVGFQKAEYEEWIESNR